jgi:hypothetical protein
MWRTRAGARRVARSSGARATENAGLGRSQSPASPRRAGGHVRERGRRRVSPRVARLASVAADGPEDSRAAARCFQLAKRRELISSNPSADAERVSLVDDGAFNVLEPAEFEVVYRAALGQLDERQEESRGPDAIHELTESGREMFAAALATKFSAGLRMGETRDLQWHCVDFSPPPHALEHGAARPRWAMRRLRSGGDLGGRGSRSRSSGRRGPPPARRSMTWSPGLAPASPFTSEPAGACARSAAPGGHGCRMWVSTIRGAGGP